MIKYCPIMSLQRQGGYYEECLGEDCAWADKDGKCLIVKALKQMTDPISTLIPQYPVDQNILHGQPQCITHWVHQDTTTKVEGGF